MAQFPPVQDRGATTSAVALWRLGGVVHVTVVVKATFSLVAGGRMAVSPPEPLVHDERVPYLPGADVSFLGRAQPREPSASVRLALFADEALQQPLIDKVVASPQPGAPCLELGPVPAAAPARRALLGDRGAAWKQQRFREIDEGFDWTYFRTAPADQRCPPLSGDEWLVLEGLLADQPTFKGQLPGVEPVLAVQPPGAGGAASPLAVQADMLIVDGERRCCSLVWRGSYPVEEGSLWPNAQVIVQLRTPSSAPIQSATGPALPPSLAPRLAAGGAGSPTPPVGSSPSSTESLRGLDSTVRMEGDVEAGDAAAAPSKSAAESFGETHLLTDQQQAAAAAQRDQPFTSARPNPSPQGVRATTAAFPGAPWSDDVESHVPVPNEDNDDTVSITLEDIRQDVSSFAETQHDAGQEAQRAAEQEAQRAAQEEAQRAAEQEAQRAAEQEAQRKAAEEAEAAKEAELDAQRQAVAEAEARRKEEADKFAAEQARVKAEQRQHAEKALEKKRDAAKTLKNRMYGGFGKKR